MGSTQVINRLFYRLTIEIRSLRWLNLEFDFYCLCAVAIHFNCVCLGKIIITLKWFDWILQRLLTDFNQATLLYSVCKWIWQTKGCIHFSAMFPFVIDFVFFIIKTCFTKLLITYYLFITMPNLSTFLISFYLLATSSSMNEMFQTRKWQNYDKKKSVIVREAQSLNSYWVNTLRLHEILGNKLIHRYFATEFNKGKAN